MARKISYQRGSVEMRNGRWTLRYRVRDPLYPNGWKSVRQFLEGCKAEKEARKKGDEILAEINRQDSSSEVTNVPTVAEFARSLWMEYLTRREVKPSTIYSYESMLKKHILPELGDKRIDQITPIDMTRFFVTANGGRASKYSLNLYSLLRALFEVAVHYDLIETNPLRRKLHRPKSVRKVKPALSAEQMAEVLSKVPDEHRALFTCAALTGLRCGELLALRWCNVDFALRRLSITHNLWRNQLVTPKTEGSAASMHLPDALADVLLDHLSGSAWTEPDDFVFCRSDGSPMDPNYLRKKVLYPALRAAGIEPGARSHGFHLFRHSAGSIIHSMTGDIKLAQEQLRRTQMSTTSDTYVHVECKVSERASEALAKAIAPT